MVGRASGEGQRDVVVTLEAHQQCPGPVDGARTAQPSQVQVGQRCPRLVGRVPHASRAPSATDARSHAWRSDPFGEGLRPMAGPVRSADRRSAS